MLPLTLVCPSSYIWITANFIYSSVGLYLKFNKLTHCLVQAEDLTEGEARVLEAYGWAPNTGLGSMLNYCDRVVHDKRNDWFISEWRARIARLLIEGYSGGCTVLSDLPKKVVEYMSNQNPEIKLEVELEHGGDCYPEIKLEGLN